MFDQEKKIGYMITKTALKIKAGLNQLLKAGGIDITADQFELLMILREKEGLSQTEMAMLTSKDKTNITRILDILEKKQLIERRKNDYDRRTYNIFLTKKGKQHRSSLQQVLQRGNQRLAEGLTNEDINEFTRIIKIINKNLGMDITNDNFSQIKKE